LRFHRALGSGSDECCTVLNIRANATNKKTWNLGARTSINQVIATDAPPKRGPGADSEEKHEPVSDIDTAEMKV
jgi:hypothetical protein